MKPPGEGREGMWRSTHWPGWNFMESFSTGVKRRSRIDEFICEICDNITGWSVLSRGSAAVRSMCGSDAFS